MMNKNIYPLYKRVWAEVRHLNISNGYILFYAS